MCSPRLWKFFLTRKELSSEILSSLVDSGGVGGVVCVCVWFVVLLLIFSGPLLFCNERDRLVVC